ncbi:hypothetical protein GCM10028819_28550 [Spirosoma humi]
MHKYVLIGLLASTLACQSHSSEQSKATQSTEKTTAIPDTLCFRQILSRDTTTLQLVINGNQATGYLDSNPYEKDRARGPFQGTVNAAQIQVDWQRSGEGTTQPYTLDLRMSGDSLSWFEGERVEQQGKWVLKDPKIGYTYVLTKTDCSTIPQP